MRRLAAALLFLLAIEAGAQQDGPPNAVLLVAKPRLQDPNFRQTVVLVTQASDSSTIGVILNRPTEAKHDKTGEAIYFGGPVLPRSIVALFRAENVPGAPAYPVLKGIYLSMHPGIVEPLLASPGKNYRLYAGFSGWAPRQLESEMGRDDWYMLPASEELLFRRDTENLWRELVERAQKRNAPQVRGSGAGYTFPYEVRAPDLFCPGAADAGGRCGRPRLAGGRAAAGGAPGVS